MLNPAISVNKDKTRFENMYPPLFFSLSLSFFGVNLLQVMKQKCFPAKQFFLLLNSGFFKAWEILFLLYVSESFYQYAHNLK